MAFETLNHYTDRLKHDWDRLKANPLSDRLNVKSDAEFREYDTICGRMDQLENDLSSYYLEVLKPVGKWKAQQLYCLTVLGQISPARAAGLIIKPKRKRHATTDAGAE